MGRKRASTERDGIPTRTGLYLLDWLRPTDIPQLLRLEADSFPEPLTFRQLVRLWLMPISNYIVVRQGRKVVAYIGFQLFGPAAHTISMGVHPEFRRQGLATLVQRAADRVAANRGARWFTGEVRVSNAAQLRFLEGLGWQAIGVCPGFFHNGEDAVVVWNWLT